MAHLPKFFMIYKSHGFKFYKNCVMFPSNNSYNPVNVASPLMNVTIRAITKYTKPQTILNGVLTRDTLRQMYPFNYKFTGYEAVINLDGSRIIVPAIYFLDCEKLILPKGSPILTPPTELVARQIEARSYLEADIILENGDTLPPIAPVVHSAAQRPSAAPHSVTQPPSAAPHSVTQPPSAAQQPSAAQRSQAVYPAHIKQIIIADSIQRNECCVITD
jgi:hypothetical protein